MPSHKSGNEYEYEVFNVHLLGSKTQLMFLHSCRTEVYVGSNEANQFTQGPSERE